jgi:hypothetical protein
MSEEDFSKFTAPKPNDELHQGSEVPVTFGIDPNDRLPVPVAPDNEDRPPPLAVDTLVCMEDKRSFVIRNSDGSVYVSFEPAEVQRAPDGRYFVSTARLMQTVNATYPDREVGGGQSRENFTTFLYGSHCSMKAMVDGQLSTVVQVEPIRPACGHYLRMMTDISADRTRRFLTRSCLAMRSETGEYYSVGDAAIFACSLRSPRHLESEKILDDFDALKVQQANERVAAGSFNVDDALEREHESLGILG